MTKIYYTKIKILKINMNNDYKNYIFFILLCFINLSSNEEISIEINKIIENTSFAIIFDANDNYYNIITQSYHFALNKKNNSIILENKNQEDLDSKAILFEQGNKKFIFLSSKVIYPINFNENNEILEITKESEGEGSTNSNLVIYQYLGYFSQKMENEIDKFTNTDLEEIIFYRNNSNYISFYYKIRYKQIDIYKSEDNILEYLSCKKFENGKYVCAFNDIINDAKILKICMFFCNDYNCNITYYQDIPNLKKYK